MNMPITLRENENREQFSSVHFLAYGPGDGRGTITLSGVAELNLRSRGADWHREKVALLLDLSLATSRLAGEKAPQAGKSWAFEAEQWVLNLSLNSVSNAGQTGNVGWAIDKFELAQSPGGANEIQVNAELAVSDAFGVLHRIGYYVSLIGKLTEVDAKQ